MFEVVIMKGQFVFVCDQDYWSQPIPCLSQAIDEGAISLPPPKCLPFLVTEVLHLFVGDDGFALKKHHNTINRIVRRQENIQL